MTLVEPFLVSARPLSASRLNDAALDVLAALDGGDFRSPDAVARKTNRDATSVAALFERLHRRGFLAWRPAREPSYRPPVSVVVTVRDERDHLRACLDALGGLDYPTYEVVVVDDGSTDGTAEVAANHRLAADGRLRYVPVGSAADPLGIGASRNRGVAAAAHDVVAFTDADCRPGAAWLADLVPCLARHDLVGGRVRPAGDSPASAYEGHNASLDMGPEASRVDPEGRVPYLPTANLVGRRIVFEALEFPARDVAEDVEVCWRALEAGFDVVYAPTGVVEHVYRTGVRDFAARRSIYGTSEALLAREHGREVTRRVVVPTTAVLVVALGLISLVASGPAATAAFAVGVAVVGLTVAGRVVRPWRWRRRLAPAVTARDVVDSWARTWVSFAYALALEITRYYAGPLALLGGLGWLAGARWPAAVLLGVVAVSVLLPFLVEYAVYDPDVTFVGYGVYYFADHLGYQHGVYRGVLVHGTLAHVAPTGRLRFVGPGAGLLTRLVPHRAAGFDEPRPAPGRRRG